MESLIADFLQISCDIANFLFLESDWELGMSSTLKFS